MRFPLIQLYVMNRSKPIVGIDITEVQWDYCDLEGLPPEREAGTVSMVNHGKIPRGQYEDLPEVFVDTDGNEHRIEDIHTMRSSQ
jgi:hypothetical protein|tara:strand:- start:432 stop:686 length:255 start_codon:yes stop_codon:yes gene_type:complete